MSAHIYTGSDAACVSETTCLTLHQRRAMGCCASKSDVLQPAQTITRQEMCQRQSLPVAPPVAKGPSRSSQRSRANSGPRPPPTKDATLPWPERPRSNSNPRKRPPMLFDEDVPPVPSHTSRTRARSTSSSKSASPIVRVGKCYRRWPA